MAVDRLIGILAILLREEKVTAAQLAARLEVNRRNPHFARNLAVILP